MIVTHGHDSDEDDDDEIEDVLDIIMNSTETKKESYSEISSDSTSVKESVKERKTSVVIEKIEVLDTESDIDESENMQTEYIIPIVVEKKSRKSSKSTSLLIEEILCDGLTDENSFKQKEYEENSKKVYTFNEHIQENSSEGTKRKSVLESSDTKEEISEEDNENLGIGGTSCSMVV